MLVNSDTAHKTLKNLNEEIQRLSNLEMQNRTYSHSPGEDPIIPEYDFIETQKKLSVLHAQVRDIKHAIGYFNQTTKIEIPTKEYYPKEHDIISEMTVDEALSYMQWLHKRKTELSQMLSIPKVERHNAYNAKAPDITHRNFDIEQVQKVYDGIAETLINTQQAINVANLTLMFEI